MGAGKAGLGWRGRYHVSGEAGSRTRSIPCRAHHPSCLYSILGYLKYSTEGEMAGTVRETRQAKEHAGTVRDITLLRKAHGLSSICI